MSRRNRNASAWIITIAVVFVAPWQVPDMNAATRTDVGSELRLVEQALFLSASLPILHHFPFQFSHRVSSKAMALMANGDDTLASPTHIASAEWQAQPEQAQSGANAITVRRSVWDTDDESSHERNSSAAIVTSVATICTVTTAADGGAGSLRHCLLNASANDTINFDPAAFPPAAPATIAPFSVLPIITMDGLTIDASDAGVILNGSGLASGSGLVVDGANGVTARGLQIRNFPGDGIELIGGARNITIGGEAGNARNVIYGNRSAGIAIHDPGTNDNRVQGNIIGTDAAGAAGVGNQWGVVVALGAQNNVIGGVTAGARNVISGNGFGVQIQSGNTTGNQVLGNHIGVNAAGTAKLGNSYGVVIGYGAQNNRIGNATVGGRNLISGNLDAGILLTSSNTISNQVVGNFIGVNLAGTSALGNAEGVLINPGAQNNFIGGEQNGAGNLISGNAIGILIQNVGANGNIVQGNLIGTDVTGNTALRNTYDGILIGFGAQNNVIGGANAGARNVISGHENPLVGYLEGGAGVHIQNSGTTGNQVLGNLIGTNAAGAAAIRNSWGVLVNGGAKNNTIGGDAPGARNLISGNHTGVQIEHVGTTDNRVPGNFIGTNAAGTAAIRNEIGVVVADGAQANVVGGGTDASRNVISGNQTGIDIGGGGANGNRVIGNHIGTDWAGSSALGNEVGIAIYEGAQNNAIGGTLTGERNVISASTYYGVWIEGAGTTGNQVLGNYIGVNAAGTARLGNQWGIGIAVGAQSNIVGGEASGARNVISGNSQAGVQIQEANGNSVLGNFIGTDASGTQPLGNRFDGIAIGFGAQNNVVGGMTASARNLISGNGVFGVRIQITGTIGNQVQGNFIGTDWTGNLALPNAVGVGISLGAANNTVGGASEGARNVISGNTFHGVEIGGVGVTENKVIGNFIGVNATGATALGNKIGIVIGMGAPSNTIGGDVPGARNVISGSSQAGIQIQEANTNQVLGNFIGVNAAGDAPVGNKVGVALAFGAQRNIVGGAAGARNFISGNIETGILFQGNGTTGNQVLGNVIGLNASQDMPLGNTFGVAILTGASDNIVGDGNVINRNVEGVVISGTTTTGNRVVSSMIQANATYGILLRDGANSNSIGMSNTIAYNGSYGVGISGATTLKNTITRNSIHHNDNNGFQIKFISAPLVISPVTPCYMDLVERSNCPFCSVEFFANPDPPQAGTVFLAVLSAPASGVLPLLPVIPPASMPHVFATVTLDDKTTSEFYALTCSKAHLPNIQKDYTPPTPIVQR